MKLEKILKSINLVDELDEDTKKQILEQVQRDLDDDEGSREDWLERVKQWEELAGQKWEEKTYPWQQAANVKYPLVSVAALQFHARAYPTLIPSFGNIVKTVVIGKDPDGQKTARAKRVEDFLSWQLRYDIPFWEEGMDKLFQVLPVSGCMFKKIYFDPSEGKNCSYPIHPRYLVVNQGTTCLNDATRISEVLPLLSKRDIQSKQKQENEELKQTLFSTSFEFRDPDEDVEGDGLYRLVEQHTYLDLDEDGYSEPYIVTFHPNSNQLARIVHNIDEKKMILDYKGEVKRLESNKYYLKYPFIPSFDGSFYDYGFGHLLGPLNEAVNTLLNQVLDSGTLHNLQAGFIGRALRMKMSDAPLQPGEWRPVNATGDDLRKQIVPLPTKEPSSVLLELLGMLITAGKEVASVAEIFVGKMPGQNTPATTTMASIEQGMKLFTAIYRRIYRTLDEEFKMLYELNALYLDPGTISEVLDEPVGPEDFTTDDYNIYPSADPSASTAQEQLAKSQQLMELLPVFGPVGLLKPDEVLLRILTAQGHTDVPKLINGMQETGQPQMNQQPDPKVMEMQMKSEMDQAKNQAQIQAIEKKSQLDQQSAQAKLAMKAQEHQMDMQHQARLKQIEGEGAKHMQNIFIQKELSKLAVEKEKSKIQTSKSGKTTQSQNKS